MNIFPNFKINFLCHYIPTENKKQTKSFFPLKPSRCLAV